eukprot:TRINITY_DN18598_c0_g1_i1.p1 TRINITY_DN18598_c0_g1~~TRINITY_DN18598_c0_g1_i1.p1  ORF type:complete len:308 (+),score=128.55 TRINITY_DN18598_c0_g1_i1:54-977(+)
MPDSAEARGKSPPQLPAATQEVFSSVIGELSANLQAFMDGVPATTARYTDALEDVKRANPTISRKRSVLSPLLRCRDAPPDSGDPLPPPPLPGPAIEDPGVKLSPPRSAPRPTAGQLLEDAKAAADDSGSDDPVAFLEKHFKKLRVKEGQTLKPPPADHDLVKKAEELKHEAYELRVVLSGICDWIEMQMPAIKLEDNRGVQIQEQVIRHLIAMRGAVQGIYERERQYWEKVADYASKYYEHGQAHDQWGEAMEVYNAEHWDQLERDWREMRHIVVLAARLLALNMDKLVAPRESRGYSGAGTNPYM